MDKNNIILVTILLAPVIIAALIFALVVISVKNLSPADKERRNLALTVENYLDDYASSHGGKFPTFSEFTSPLLSNPSSLNEFEIIFTSDREKVRKSIPQPSSIKNDQNAKDGGECDVPGALNYTVSTDQKTKVLLICFETTKKWSNEYDSYKDIKTPSR